MMRVIPRDISVCAVMHDVICMLDVTSPHPCLGVASFQFHVSHTAHLTFAFLFFAPTLAYICTHTYITRHVEYMSASHEPLLETRNTARVTSCVYHTRVVCSVVGVVAFVWVCMVGPMLQIAEVLPGECDDTWARGCMDEHDVMFCGLHTLIFMSMSMSSTCTYTYTCPCTCPCSSRCPCPCPCPCLCSCTCTRAHHVRAHVHPRPCADIIGFDESNPSPSTAESLVIQLSALCEILVFTCAAVHFSTYATTFKRLRVCVSVVCDEETEQRRASDAMVSGPAALQIDSQR